MNRLVVVSTTRYFDVQNLYEFEPFTVPLSRFNTDGTIRKCNKSRKMEKDIEEESLTVMDFMVALRMICTDTSKCQTFGALSNTLLHTIFRMFKYGSNVGVVCDQYDVVDSIEAYGRARRGQVVSQEIKIHNEQAALPK